MKRGHLVSSVLVLLLMMSGCGTQQATSTKKSTAKKATSSKVVSQKQKSSVKSKAVVAQTRRANSKSDSTTTKQTGTSQTTSQTMNLNEIRNGNYQSIMGDWQMVATSGNHYDGKGIVWGAPNPEGKLTVMSSKVMDTQYTLAGKTLSDKTNPNQSRQGTAKIENGALDVSGDVGAMAVSFHFYPKGVPLTGWGDDVPATIKTNTDRILIRTSSDAYVEVFARKSDMTSADQTKTQLVMNTAEIQAGNYASMNGTWKNGQGRTITIHNTQMKFSNFGLERAATPGTINGLKMTVPVLDAAIRRGNDETTYNHHLRVDTSDGPLKLVGNVGVKGSSGALYEILFMPSGYYASLNNGDASKERIVATGTQNDVQSVPANTVYYRVN